MAVDWASRALALPPASRDPARCEAGEPEA